MVLRVSALHSRLFGACLGACFFLTACLPQTTNTPLIAPTCISPAPDANPYTSNEVTQGVRNIYQKSYTDLGNARQDALFQLGQNMEHLSSQVDVANDNAHMVRITVTYLDPILIQYIVLNQQLNDPSFSPNVVNSPIETNSFNLDLNNRLQQLGARNEMLFIVTITSPFYSKQLYNSTELTVKLATDQMTLSGASNIPVKPTHFDHILNESMDITQGPVSGIVGYPIALETDQNQCTLIIDQWTNTLTLDVPSVILGNASPMQKFWNIPYRSLVMQSDAHPTPTYDPYIFNNPINKLSDPPTPNWTPVPNSTNISQQTYWEGMGRYIWNLVITESHH